MRQKIDMSMNKEQKQKIQESSGWRFSWGHGISLAIFLFVAATLAMVTYIVSLDYHLVSENHYQEAVEYQTQIDRIKQTRHLNDEVLISYSKQEEVIRVEFPEELFKLVTSGTIELYRPDDSKKDRSYEIALKGGSIQVIQAEGLTKGRWYVKVEWNDAEKGYYLEKSIFI